MILRGKVKCPPIEVKKGHAGLWNEELPSPKRSDPLLFFLLSSCASLAFLFSFRISSSEERLNPIWVGRGRDRRREGASSSEERLNPIWVGRGRDRRREGASSRYPINLTSPIPARQSRTGVVDQDGHVAGRRTPAAAAHDGDPAAAARLLAAPARPVERFRTVGCVSTS